MTDGKFHGKNRPKEVRMGYDVTHFTVHMPRGAPKLRLFFDHGLEQEKYA